MKGFEGCFSFCAADKLLFDEAAKILLKPEIEDGTDC